MLHPMHLAGKLQCRLRFRPHVTCNPLPSFRRMHQALGVQPQPQPLFAGAAGAEAGAGAAAWGAAGVTGAAGVVVEGAAHLRDFFMEKLLKKDAPLASGLMKARETQVS
jgi:hypothetical protein